MIVRVLFCLLISSQLQASARVDFNELRLKKMAKVMNSRDFELMLNSIRQLEILDRVCEKEKAQQKIPTTCLELAEKLKIVGWESNHDVAQVEEACRSHFSELTDTEIESLAQKHRLLTPGCREKVLARSKILSYKKSGKRFE
jgi:hypothetical protein